MSNQLTLMTAQSLAADREREVRRSIEASLRGTPTPSNRPSLRIRIAALVLRLRHRAVPAS
jgi:hypothetical protein